ncbi:hypothetical protein KAW18_15245 [candidate division WOR-3 bacterium]|nr:hypothetical protein [candidate division WOR-3 bacterium]MCK4528723.1 hypothetical protein [candidate division WOR-3 bacterium]
MGIFGIVFSAIGVVILIAVTFLIRVGVGGRRSRHRDYGVKYVICAAHGIRTKGEWITSFINILKEKYPDYADNKKARLIPIRYGRLPASVCALGFVKRYLINWMRRKLEAYCEQFPAASVSYFAHSYGTMLGYEALRKSDDIYLDKMVLVASVVSSHETFDDTIGMGKVREIHCFCSKEDEVCKYNPFGHSGYWGFLESGNRKCKKKPHKKLKVYNYCKKNLEHSGYFTDKKTLNEWMKILDSANAGIPVPEKHWLCPFMVSSDNYPPVCVRGICKFYDEKRDKCLLMNNGQQK